MLKYLTTYLIAALRTRHSMALEIIALRHQLEVLQRNAKCPRLKPSDRTLIGRMSLDNPLWGAPRIHSELLKLGYDICETTIAKYMVRQPGPSAQTWRTFIRNHMAEIVSIDFFTVHTAVFKTLYVFLAIRPRSI